MSYIKYAIAIFSFLFVSTLAAESLKVDLEAFRVLPNEDGSELLEIAETAAPGDVIEYRAAYANNSSSALNGVIPEIPVPAGLIFQLPGNGANQADLPSEVLIDGGEWVAFSSLTNEDAVFNPQQVSALRWPALDLAPQTSRTIAFRVTVAR
jgi:uncharacterized repeat protein (TIGR01451 family)